MLGMPRMACFILAARVNAQVAKVRVRVMLDTRFMAYSIIHESKDRPNSTKVMYLNM